MDFRLKVFVTAAEELNYSNAAKKLNITQPAVTHHIKLLEEQYGLQLLSRKGNKFTLTYSGEIFLERAKKILSIYKEIEQESILLSNVAEGVFTIGVPEPIYYGIFPDFTADYCRLSPKATIYHKILKLKEISEAVKSQQVNVGITVSHTPPTPEEEAGGFFTDRLIALTSSPVKSDLYYDLQETKLLLYDGDPETSAEITSIISKAGHNLNNLTVAATMKDPTSALRFMAEYGLGNKGTTYPLIGFFWKSQVSKMLESKTISPVNITELQDQTPPTRRYCIAQATGKEIPGFATYARGWAEKKGLAL